MNDGNIDDLLVNIDDNLDGKPKTGEPLEEAEKPVDYNFEIQKEKQQEDKIQKENVLSSRQIQDLSFLNNIDSENLPADSSITEKPDAEASEEDAVVIENEFAAHGQAEVHVRAQVPQNNKTKLKNVEFTLRGSRSWNTREPYILSINQDKLFADYSDLEKTFYFIKDGIPEQVIQGEMKRAMFKFIRDPGKSIVEEYSSYVKSKISQSVTGLSGYFDIPEDKSLLFVYHLGVLTLYKIILSVFQDNKTGYCFKLLHGTSVVKYVPSEFIKEIILKWHNENINSTDLQYDAILEYNEMKRVISKFYMAEYEKYNKKLDDMIAKANLNVGRTDRDQFFKRKWNEWFGRINIFVYNRFLERTVFKTVK